jgi:hypothetical protein
MPDLVWDLLYSTLGKLLTAMIPSTLLALYAKRLRQTWPTAVVYGLATTVMLLWLIEWADLGPSKERRIYDWMVATGVAIEKKPLKRPGVDFFYLLKEPHGGTTHETAVYRRTGDEFVTIECLVNFSRAHVLAFEKLTPRQRLKFDRSIELELSRYGISFAIRHDVGKAAQIRLDDLVLVTKGFTSLEFMKRLLFMRNGQKMAILLVQAGLDDE